ncbi:hypothetical protein K469DRAFT_714775 [Zopfia rhizophila CBS 207.26]|uniref:Uncharacterized protein n=1 Tax=Zopfia rhizophila CBS 207.26 TaxID=1314779 RepID=A0A6A6DRW8_9PEZI|nr:hypothetical protein K469DRAFT_714775 [Zopfia rhizophila CBS 207.26]
MSSTNPSNSFVQPDLPTPPASSVASTTANPLPRPRTHPLKPGGAKESELICYLDQSIRTTNGKFGRRMFKDKDLGELRKYHSFREAAKDIAGIIDVVWVSGTPTIQVAYLLSIALLITDFLPELPPSPRATLRLLDKMDHAFSSLLQGKDIDAGEQLPGFENGWRVSMTEKVRLKSLVDRTRLIVVEALSEDRKVEEDDEVETEEEEMDDGVGVGNGNGLGDMEEDEEEWGIGKVYERTIGELGELLGGEPIGIITED